MTVQTDLPPSRHNSDGVTTTFEYDFKIQRVEHLKATQTVVATGVTTVLEIESATGINNDGGGTVTFAEAPIDGCTITIDSIAPLSQIEQFNGNKLPPETVERGLDAVVIQNQGQQSQIDRCARFPASDDQIPTFPARAQRAGRVVAFDATGANFELIEGALASQAAVDAANAAADRAVAASDYPYTSQSTKTVDFMPVDADHLTLFLVDTTGGEVTVTLDDISNLQTGWNIGINRIAGSNDIVIQCSNGDLINVQSSLTVSTDLLLLDIKKAGSGFAATDKALINISVGVGAGDVATVDQSVTDIASAATVDLSASATLEINITGTTTVTAFNGVAGVTYKCRAAAAFTLTDGADLILPTSDDITTEAGDTFDVYMIDADTALVRNYQRFSGSPIDTDFVKTALNASGAAPIYACRAWANFNGSTAAIRASGNITSVTKLGTGSYRVNFTTVMPDADFSAPVGLNRDGTVTYCTGGPIAKTTGYVDICTTGSTGVGTDYLGIDVAVFR